MMLDPGYLITLCSYNSADTMLSTFLQQIKYCKFNPFYDGL